MSFLKHTKKPVISVRISKQVPLKNYPAKFYANLRKTRVICQEKNTIGKKHLLDWSIGKPKGMFFGDG